MKKENDSLMHLNFRKFSMADNKNDKQPPKSPKGQGPNKPDDNFDWSKVVRMVLGWGAVIFAAVIVMQVFRTGQENFTEITFAEYRRLLNETDKIKEATITKSDINDYYFRADLTSETSVTIEGTPTKVDAISVYIPEPIIKEEESLWKERGIT